MEIIKPNKTHLKQIRELWYGQDKYHSDLDSRYYLEASKDRSETFETYVREAINTNNSFILIAIEDNQLYGFITYEIGESDYEDTKITPYGEILELFVTEDARGKGIGKSLMTAAEEDLKSKGMEWMKLQCSSYNENALDFYERIGYEDKQKLLYKSI